MIERRYALKPALWFVVIWIPFLRVSNCLGSTLIGGWIGYPSSPCFYFVCNVRKSMLTFSYPPKEIHQIWVSNFSDFILHSDFLRSCMKLSNKRYKNFELCIFNIPFHSLQLSTTLFLNVTWKNMTKRLKIWIISFPRHKL